MARATFAIPGRVTAMFGTHPRTEVESRNGVGEASPSGACEHGDDAAAVAALGRPDLDAALDLDQALPHAHGPAIEVEVGV